jgi:hypothetical protein
MGPYRSDHENGKISVLNQPTLGTEKVNGGRSPLRVHISSSWLVTEDLALKTHTPGNFPTK